MGEMIELEKAVGEITEIARGFGLDPFPIHYEICPPEIIYTLGAYGMPTRFTHWSFGKAFYRMKLQYDLGLSKIYELIINANPSYAFLLAGNSLLQNKLIVAHVLAHADFFKNNYLFSRTSRDMIESMTTTAERIRQYEMKYGKERVEKFIDAVLAVQEHIDPYLSQNDGNIKTNNGINDHLPNLQRRTEYDDLWRLEDRVEKNIEEQVQKKFPPTPEKDLVLFISEHSKALEDWQRDIMTMLREEMLYFWPQIETKIMNEGWAAYWHTKIMRELDLSEQESIEFAKLNSAVIQPSRRAINPYYLGKKIFVDIEKRWDNPTSEEQGQLGRKLGGGKKKIFEVREMEGDSSFIRNYLSDELIKELDMFIYKKVGNEWIITEKEPKKVREELCNSRINGGFPYIVVEDGDYSKNGELCLKHQFEEVELDIKYLEKTLPYVYQLWGKAVHLETTIENRAVLFTFDGKKNFRKFL